MTSYPKGLDAKARGRATYKGRSYPYLAMASFERDGAPVERILLSFRNGSKQFWADLCPGFGKPTERQAVVTKTYREPITLRRLQELASPEYREENGCPNCGSLSCSAAYGRRGLCDED